LIALLAAAIFASLAFVAETNRSEYEAAIEPIRRSNTRANERILAGAREEVRRGKLKPAAARFAEASSALDRTLCEIGSVPRPVADEVRLLSWIA
jgi:hypothetical protein